MEWADLKKPIYHGHAGMSAPSRSGTTHLTVETVLQGMGWKEGWAEWKAIAGNFKTVTEQVLVFQMESIRDLWSWDRYRFFRSFIAGIRFPGWL